MEKIKYPIRLNRYLYLKGFFSRRRSDRFIEQGLIFVNGKIAKLGQKINAGDKISFDKSIQNFTKNYKYFIFNKPIGVVSHNPQKGELSVEDITKMKELHPIGRLDKASSGLMLLSNDGRIVDKILNPKFAHQRTYEVKVNKRITDSALRKLARGVNIEGYLTKPAKTKRINENTFLITLTEGKKHQIRRMCSALRYEVLDLKRVKMLNLKLADLQPGDFRELTKQERKQLLQTLQLADK